MKKDISAAKMAGLENESAYVPDELKATDEVRDLLAQHKTHDAAEQRLRLIDESIAALEADLQAAKTKPSSIDHLVRRREDLLASVMVGDASQVELEELDAEIAKVTAAQAEANARSKKKIAEVEQTLQGLKRKRDSVSQDLAQMSAKSKSMTHQTLMAEMNMLSEEYLAAARDVNEKLVRLIALNNICAGLGVFHVEIVRSNSFDYAIPIVQLPGCTEAVANSNRKTHGVLFANDGFFSHEVSRAVDAERQVWIKAGVTRHIELAK